MFFGKSQAIVLPELALPKVQGKQVFFFFFEG